MGSYRSSGRGIQVPLLAIANEFIRIHMFTRVHDPRCGDSILRAEPPFGNPAYAPVERLIIRQRDKTSQDQFQGTSIPPVDTDTLATGIKKRNFALIA